MRTGNARKQDGRTTARDGERGVIIVVALLVLVSLAGVALVATHRVSLEIDRSGNYRVTKEGAGMTMSGFIAGLALMETQGVNLMEGVGAEDVTKFSLDMDTLAGDALFDLEEGGSFGRAVTAEEVEFNTAIDVIRRVNTPAPGFAVGQFTFVKAVATTRGSFGKKDDNEGDETNTRLRTAQRQFRVFMTIGPLTQ